MHGLIALILWLGKLVGMALLAFGMVGAILYFMARRNEDPNGAWPFRAMLGYGGLLIFAFGLVTLSFGTMMIGAAAMMCGYWMSDRDVPPPPPA